jgi:hypothetical protein
VGGQIDAAATVHLNRVLSRPDQAWMRWQWKNSILRLRIKLKLAILLPVIFTKLSWLIYLPYSNLKLNLYVERKRFTLWKTYQIVFLQELSSYSGVILNRDTICQRYDGMAPYAINLNICRRVLSIDNTPQIEKYRAIQWQVEKFKPLQEIKPWCSHLKTTCVSSFNNIQMVHKISSY